MWCWFKGWRGWLPLLRFSGAPVFLPVQREKGWRAEHMDPRSPSGWWDSPGLGLLQGSTHRSSGICAQGSAPCSHPPDTTRALVHSSRHWGGSGAPWLPQAPRPQGFRLPHLQSTRYNPCQCFKGCQWCLRPSGRRNHTAELDLRAARAEHRCSLPPAAIGYEQICPGGADLSPVMGGTAPIVGCSAPHVCGGRGLQMGVPGVPPQHGEHRAAAV